MVKTFPAVPFAALSALLIGAAPAPRRGASGDPTRTVEDAGLPGPPGPRPAGALGRDPGRPGPRRGEQAGRSPHQPDPRRRGRVRLGLDARAEGEAVRRRAVRGRRTRRATRGRAVPRQGGDAPRRRRPADAGAGRPGSGNAAATLLAAVPARQGARRGPEAPGRRRASRRGGVPRHPLRSKPLGFYTWSAALGDIYRQDRMLQTELQGRGRHRAPRPGPGGRPRVEGKPMLLT